MKPEYNKILEDYKFLLILLGLNILILIGLGIFLKEIYYLILAIGLGLQLVYLIYLYKKTKKKFNLEMIREIIK